MSKKTVAGILLFILLFATTGARPFIAQTATEADSIRSKVTKYGIGKKVTVVLRDDTKIKGKIAEIDQDRFTVDRGKRGAPRTIAYTDVSKVKKASNLKWFLIAGAAAAAIAIIIPLSQRCRNEGAGALCL